MLCVGIVVFVHGVIVILQLRLLCVFFFQAEDGIRDLVRSRGLGDVYKRQVAPDVPPVTVSPISKGPDWFL